MSVACLAQKSAQASAPTDNSSGTLSTGILDPFYDQHETARVCSFFISDLFHCLDSNPAANPVALPIAPPLAKFIAYALHRTRLHHCVTFAALFLLQRLKLRFPAARGSSGHRLFISAFMIASKVVYDRTYSNKSWCVVGQGMFPLKEINAMERELCSLLEWKLTFVPTELADFEAKVRRDYSHLSRHTRPPQLTTLDTSMIQEPDLADGELIPSWFAFIVKHTGDPAASVASFETTSSTFAASTSSATRVTSVLSASLSDQPEDETGWSRSTRLGRHY